MNKIKNVKVSKKELVIDNKIEKQVLDDTAWEKELGVSPVLKSTSIRLSSRTISRAKMFARLHHQRGYQSWLKQVIEERINNEYEIYKGLRSHIAKQ
jgi:hypothetical protein